jgi:lysyl-tRNA synthetase class 2
LYHQAFGLDAFTAPLEALRDLLADYNIESAGLERDDWLDLLMTHRLQPDFAPDRLLLLFDFPPSQCALARIEGVGVDAVAQRFEAFLCPLELANGYHELVDAAEQEQRFRRDCAKRTARALAVPPQDLRLLQALKHGLPDCAGVALGIDRLLMAIWQSNDISAVIGLPFERA